MGRPRIAVTRLGLPGTGVERLTEWGEVDVWNDRFGPPHDQLADFLDGATAALTMSQDRIDAKLLDRCPSLKMIGQASAGYDNLALSALAERGVQASNTPGVLQETTADYTWGLYFALQRRIVEADRFVRSGGWTNVTFDLLLGRDLFGSTLGIVGYGQIGTAVARRAAGFRMRVIHADPSAPTDEVSTQVSIDQLLETADIVSVHVSLTEHTRGFLSTSAFEKMKSSAVLVNVSRGSVVDEAALVDALDRSLIAGAALDVYAEEPIDGNHPLARFDNVVLSPHIASASVATRTRMVDVAADNITAFIRGEPLLSPLVLTDGAGS